MVHTRHGTQSKLGSFESIYEIPSLRREMVRKVHFTPEAERFFPLTRVEIQKSMFPIFIPYDAWSRLSGKDLEKGGGNHPK